MDRVCFETELFFNYISEKLCLLSLCAFSMPLANVDFEDFKELLTLFFHALLFFFSFYHEILVFHLINFIESYYLLF